MDVNSISQTDTTVQTSDTFTKTFRVGAILDVTPPETVEDVFAFQFVLHYDQTRLTAQADPPTSGDFFGSTCYVLVSCSENADAAVKFGKQTATGSVNWEGLISANQAASVIKIDDPAGFGPGTVLVGFTLLGAVPGKTISVDTILANVAFELDTLPASPLSFTLSDVIITDHVATPIPGITVGGPVSASITNSPPRAAGTVSNLNPAEGEAINFDATSSTDDTLVTGYIWDFGVGDLDGDGFPETSCNVVAGTCTSPTATFTYTTAGTYYTTLRVRDAAGATGAARDALGTAIENDQRSHINFTILVRAFGSPVLDPIGPKTGNEQALLTFTATATDPTNDPLTFSLGPGAPSGASITTAGVFTWTPSEAQGPGSYQVTVIVSDPSSNTDSETITITVNEVNLAPVLTVPGSQTVDEGLPLTFTVTATDPDQPANTVTLACTNCAALGATFNAATGQFSWTPTEAQGVGDYTVTFTATDNGTPSLSDTKSVAVHVNEVNAPPTASFTVDDSTPVRGQIVNFDASASTDPDPGGSITSYEWNFGDGNTTTVTINTITHKYTTIGSYTITLKVTDITATTGTTTMVIAVVNQPPVISVTADKTVATPGELITVTLAYSDADGDPLTVTVNWGDGTVDPVTGNAASHAYTDRAGFTIAVTAEDGQGDPVSRTIHVIISDAPLLSITLDKAAASTGEAVTVAISGSDPDGSISTTRIDWGDGTVEALTSAQTSATHKYTAAGTYTITVSVTDNRGIITTRTSTVTIEAPAFPLWVLITVFIVIVAGGVLVYLFKIRKPSKVTAS